MIAGPPHSALVARLLLLGPLLLVSTAVFVPGAAVAQVAQQRTDGSDVGSLARDWELRGVAIADGGSLAILEHRSSGRQQLLRAGDVLVRGVAVAAIGAEQVVLDSAGRAVTLRLGHGGRALVSRLGIPLRPRWPPSVISRQRGR